jgi:hypothetical protein
MRKLLTVLLFCCFLTSVVAVRAQQTLGSLNGTVTDASGAAVPGAVVTATDDAIGLTRTTKAQSNGYFQIFNLPVGTYKVTAKHDGFDTMELIGIEVQEAQAKTVNVPLKVGQVSQSIEVTANPLLNATDATNGYTLDAAQIELTPLATGSFTQLAILSPGVSAELLGNLDTNSGLGNQPITANGQRDTSNTFQVNGVDATNLFNGKTASGAGSQRIVLNTGETSSIGGAAGVGTSVFSSNGNSLPSPPPEFVQELRVNSSLYDAQQGATSGAQIDVNTASGTNHVHGQLYGSFANNDLNAAPFFFKQEALLSEQGIGTLPANLANPALHRWTTGATVGGPIVKDKLFFFFGYQHRYNSDKSTGLSQMTVPQGLTDDRSAAGLTSALTSWLGAPVPASFTGINPIAQAILSSKLPNGQYLIPTNQNPTAAVEPDVPNVTLEGTSMLIADQATVAVDYDVTKTDRLSAKWYYQNAPVSKPFGLSETAGFPVTQSNGAQVFALDNTITIGSKINWEQRLGIDRLGSYSSYTQTAPGGSFGVGGGTTAPAPALTPNVLGGLEITEFGLDASNESTLTTGPESAFVDTGYFQNRINPSTNAIFSVGKHTIVVGGGYSYTQLNVENHRQGLLDEVESKGFEDFLEGEVAKSQELDSVANGRNLSNRYYRSNEIAAYVQDKWQALPNLSITAGVRYDYHGGLTEKFGDLFNFNPSLYSVTGTVASGFDVSNAGFEIAGNNKFDPTPGTTNSTLTGRQWGVSPRVGFAYAPKRFNNRIVINGGAGIYYDRGELFSYLSQPAGGGIGGPFGVTESAPLVTSITGNGKTLANPLGSPIFTPPSTNPATITTALQQVLGNGPSGPNGYSGAAHPADGTNCSAVDGQENFSDCPDSLNFGAYDKNNVLPYTINYALNLQWQPRNDLAITIGYNGNRGRHAVIPVPFNEPGIATPTNPIHGETDTYGFETLNANSVTSGGDINAIASEPYDSEDGGNTDFRVPFIGFNPNAALFETVGVSAYDSLQLHVVKRLSHHFQAGGSYTYGHELDEQSGLGLFFTGNNPNNLRSSYATGDLDRTHIFTANFQAQLPNFVREHSLLSYVTNDWSLTGIGVLQSGEPYSLDEFNGAVGSAFFGDFPELLNPVLPITNPKAAKKIGQGLTGNPGNFRGSGGSYIPTVSPADIAINYITPGDLGVPTAAQGNAGDPTDIFETNFASSNQRNIFRQAMQKRLDISFHKSFRISERINMRYQFNIFNVTNTTSLDIPQNQTQIRQSSACSQVATASAAACSTENLNFGQVATANGTADELSARSGAAATAALPAVPGLDQLPTPNGSGRTTTIPLGSNGATFGSVTGAIGGGRAITMGLHIIF